MRALKLLPLLLALALTLVPACASDTGDGDGVTPYGDTGDVTDEESPTVDPSTPATGGAGMMSDNTILAHSFAFAPSTLEVSVGEDVTFTNGDDVAHEVEIDGENIGRMEHGQSLTWTPAETGTFNYVCPLHPGMTGTITVR